METHRKEQHMRNEVIFDDRGRPDILVVFTPDELKLPDTLKGRKVKEYAISKYPNTMIDGRPYSLPFMPPAVNVNHDEAIRLCEAKGPGWHLITNDEWAALGRQSWENDTVPTGNTNSGKSHSHPEQTGTTYKDSYGKTLAGSGPIEWNHDRTAEGVADMVGNVWEHVGGVRFLDGQVQIIPNNEAAAGAKVTAGGVTATIQSVEHIDGEPDGSGKAEKEKTKITLSRTIAAGSEAIKITNTPSVYDTLGMTEEELEAIKVDLQQ
jgi:hypothetical protein